MKIATWNVNSLTARLQHVLDWLIANPVDVLCLQELKMSDDKFPLEVLKSAGYHAAVFGQKTYNGVAILSLAPGARRGEEHRRLRRRAFARDQRHHRHAGRRAARRQRLLRQRPGAGHREVRLQDELAARPARLAARGARRPSESGAARRLQHRAGRPRQLRPGRPGGDHPPHDRGARPFQGPAGAGPDRQLPPVRAAREELLVVGLPHARLPEEPRAAHRPHPGERAAGAARARAA